MLEAQNDPSRLLARKPAGWLLKEEKLRTSVEKHLPQITLKVRELTAEWQAERGGEVLRYGGVPLLELLEAEERAEASKKLEEKERKAAEKAAAVAKKDEKRASALPGRPSAVVAVDEQCLQHHEGVQDDELLADVYAITTVPAKREAQMKAQRLHEEIDQADRLKADRWSA